MGMYQYVVTRRGRPSNDDAIRLARKRADAEGIRLFGSPTVDTKRVPLPVIGPKTRYVVRFVATRDARHAKHSVSGH